MKEVMEMEGFEEAVHGITSEISGLGIKPNAGKATGKEEIGRKASIRVAGTLQELHELQMAAKKLSKEIPNMEEEFKRTGGFSGTYKIDDAKYKLGQINAKMKEIAGSTDMMGIKALGGASGGIAGLVSAVLAGAVAHKMGHNLDGKDVELLIMSGLGAGVLTGISTIGKKILRHAENLFE